MSSTQQAGYSGFSKKSAILAALCLVLVSGGVALFFCFSQLESRRLEVLKLYEQNVSSWLGDAAKAIEIWNTDMRKLRLRVSDSETYRLFSSDLFGLDKSVAGSINNAEHGISFSGSAAVLSEEVPAIRRILLEFMNYNGLLDARLVNREGQTILSALSTPSPLSADQVRAAVQAMETGKTTFLPVRACPNGLALDVFEPVFDLENSQKSVAVFMSTTPVLAKVSQFTARPKQIDLSVSYVVQRNGAAWDLLQAITEDRQPRASAADARLVQEMIQGIYASQLAGETLRFPLSDRKHPLED